MEKISNEDALGFLLEHKAYKEHIAISPADLWIGCSEGVVGITTGKKTDRIKGFFVSEESRRKGIGTELLKEILKYRSSSRITAFATENSVRLFEKMGMNRVSQNKNGIYFMEGYYE